MDRFVRSVSQAGDLITKLIDAGIRIDVCNIGILDNSSSTLMWNILLRFDQFERDMIVERTREGIGCRKKKLNLI